MKLKVSEKAMIKADIIFNLQFMKAIEKDVEINAINKIISRLPNSHLNYLAKKINIAASNYKQIKEELSKCLNTKNQKKTSQLTATG